MGSQKEITAAQQKEGPYRSTWHSEGCFAVEIADNANVPRLRLRDIVVIDPHAELVHSDFVYIEVRNRKTPQCVIRQYLGYDGGEIRLAPLNRNYRMYRFGAFGEPQIAILGKVVELFRSFSMPADRSDAVMAA